VFDLDAPGGVIRHLALDADVAKIDSAKDNGASEGIDTISHVLTGVGSVPMAGGRSRLDGLTLALRDVGLVFVDLVLSPLEKPPP